MHGSLVVNPREFFTIDRILHVRYSPPSHLLIQVFKLVMPLYQLGCWLLYGGLVQLLEGRGNRWSCIWCAVFQVMQQTLVSDIPWAKSGHPLRQIFPRFQQP